MAQLIRESIYPESESYISQRRLSPFLLIVFVLLIGSGAVIMGLKTLTPYALAPPNPFLAYADAFPGQPASAVEARAFSCYQHYDEYGRSEDIFCTFTPTNDVFSRVEASISEGIIRQITFAMRDDTLKVGDLELFLKKPALHTLYHTACFFLPGSFVIARTAGYGRQFSSFLSIWSVSFIQLK